MKYQSLQWLQWKKIALFDFESHFQFIQEKGSSVSKNGKEYASETSCMKEPFVHIKEPVMVKRFEKFSLHFSISLFVIRVNLLHP